MKSPQKKFIKSVPLFRRAFIGVEVCVYKGGTLSLKSVAIKRCRRPGQMSESVVHAKKKRTALTSTIVFCEVFYFLKAH